MDNPQDAPEVLETPVEETEAAPEDEQEATSEAPQVDEEKEQLRKENEELKNKNKQLFERAKKQAGTSKEPDLSNKDVLYLAKADIHEDDLDDVLEMARLKKITVQDAHKFMKPILSERTEERKTANATAVRPGARGSNSKITPEELMSKAKREALDENDMGALFNARISQKIRPRK